MMPPTVSNRASASVMKRWWSANATRRVIMPTVLPSGDVHHERSGTTVRLREGRRRGGGERGDKPPGARAAGVGVASRDGRVERGRHEQGEDSGGDEAADDDAGEGLLDLRADPA